MPVRDRLNRPRLPDVTVTVAISSCPVQANEDAMRKILLLSMGVLLAANGLAMLGWPDVWYHTLPTVAHTGPLNAHFVRDIGCAYLVSAGSLVFYALEPERGRVAALTGIAFLLLHGFIH